MKFIEGLPIKDKIVLGKKKRGILLIYTKVDFFLYFCERIMYSRSNKIS